MAALAREGFLPGYGLESGSIVGTAEPPRSTDGLDDFDLPRAPTLALREYVPGNAIYANGFRFVPRRYQLTPDDTLRFQVMVDRQVVQQVGVDMDVAPLGPQEIRAVQICDVILPSQSQISDEEEFRFQMPVAVYGMDRGQHRGGAAWAWGGLDIRFRRGVQLRLVNVGPRKEVKARLGFPLCLACGQSHSPFASKMSRDEFQNNHKARCNHDVSPTGFYADVDVDVLGWHDVEDRVAGFSVAEALRMGAARVLDMEVEDLQILAIGQAGTDRFDMLLYDPMPGGSGLLEQLTSRWEAVRSAAIELLERCPGACATSCIDCLRTYRNRFYHEHLNRHVALEGLSSASGPLVKTRDLSEKLPTTGSTTGQPQTHIETRFKRLLAAAGLPTPRCQHRMDLGAGYGATIPDFFYEGSDADEPGLCIYLDGMAGHIHGNPEQAERDRVLRARLESKDYQVIAIPSFELDDKPAMVQKIARIARYLVGKEKQRELKDDTRWFEHAAEDRPRRPALRLIRCEAGDAGAVPIFDLRVAAGAFSADQNPEPVGFAHVHGVTPQPGHFIARVVGDSMDQVVPDGAWCLWQHLGVAGATPPAVGEDIVFRRPGIVDSELGEYTFKRLAETPDGRMLVPLSTNPSHRPIPLKPGLEVTGIARLVGLLAEADE